MRQRVIASVANRFSLYEFFSILLPGAVFVIGIIPLLPRSTPVTSLGTVILLFIAGFVAGQAIHTISKSLHSAFDRPSHRQIVVSELVVPTLIPSSEIELLQDEYREMFENNDITNNVLEIDRQEELKNADTDLSLVDFNAQRTKKEITAEELDKLITMYAHIRSYLQMYGLGRARSFQAIYAMCRSLWFVFFILPCIYIIYSGLNSQGALNFNGEYVSFITDSGFPLEIIVLLSISLGIFSHIVFREATFTYKRNFARYFVTDFLTIRKSDISNNDS